MTQSPGDLVITVTAGKIGPLKAGDEIGVEVKDIGRPSNPVHNETP
jgi:2-keto-4-pentenoate hydratase/2-oxohepta-3-ene-1,7-dioic acid hydratase in catechol pathway